MGKLASPLTCPPLLGSWVYLPPPSIAQKTAREYPIKEVCPETKYAQTTSTPTLMGLNGQSFYRLDPRLPGEKQVSSRRFVTPFLPSNR